MFTASPPSSVASSRSSSPAPLERTRDWGDEKNDDLPGLNAVDVYEATLPWWRAALRRQIVKNVTWESNVIARIQDYIRTPWLDAYFVYTSSLGTHTFFMIMLPMMFFFGYEELGTELVTVLAAGVYFSSFIKDLICSPRPFAPPVTRLTIGTHHLEYGFPSTHSTNSVSMALFFYALVHQIASPSAYTTSTILLTVYAFSIVFGRIYTAMHSFIDCVAGSCLGAAIWWAQTSFPGFDVYLPAGSIIARIAEFVHLGTHVADSGARLVHLFAGFGLGERLESCITTGSYEFPLIIIPMFLLSVNQHPQPVDDCPCFEDAIAFISVVFGILMGRWGFGAWKVNGVHARSIMPGSGWVFDNAQSVWIATERNIADILVWWSVAFIKVVVGVLAIFTWRLLAKSLLHVILPPIFRFLSRLVFPLSLPHRRFYTPATDYTNVPSDFVGVNGGRGGAALGMGLGRAVPSVIDLSAIGDEEEREERNGQSEGVRSRGSANRIDDKAVGLGLGLGASSPLARYGDGNRIGIDDGETNDRLGEVEVKDKYGEPVKHYDADVITKMIVYAGIAVITSEVMPVMFELVGWGVKSWP
ncbi:Long-chain base-1-phosphate phosphatase [Pleurotus ostreatus]|nr:Long-chain base-1-phosphate phosphatase [Pleurotus ostreatus]